MNNIEPEIQIFLTTPEAIAFREFQQFHKTFMLMVSKGVFDTRNGSVEIHFDAQGQIQRIDRYDSLFDSRVKDLT